MGHSKAKSENSPRHCQNRASDSGRRPCQVGIAELMRKSRLHGRILQTLIRVTTGYRSGCSALGTGSVRWTLRIRGARADLPADRRLPDEAHRDDPAPAVPTALWSAEISRSDKRTRALASNRSE